MVAASLRRHVVIVEARQAVNQAVFFVFFCVPHLRFCVTDVLGSDGQNELIDRKKILESVHFDRFCCVQTSQLVASSLFGQSQSFIFDRFCRQIL